MTIPFEPAFAIEEYQARLDNVRHRMVEWGLDGLVLFSPANIYYLAGMDNENMMDLQALIVPLDAEPVLLVHAFERARPANSSWLRRIELYGLRDDPAKIVAALVGSLGLTRIGIEQRSVGITPSIFGRIAAALSGVRLSDPDGLVDGVRARKSPAELAYMREAGRICDAASEAGLAAVHAGAIDREIAAEIMGTAYRAGSDMICWGPVVAVGYRAGSPHSSMNGSVVRAGDTAFLEVVGQRRRYSAPVMRTAFVGDPPDEIARLAEAGAAAVDEVLRLAAPGVRQSDVARSAKAIFAPLTGGFLLTGSVGYPMGIGYQPTWQEDPDHPLNEANDRVFEAGMTFHIAIALRRLGEFGVNQRQSMVLTETGAEALPRPSARLRVVPG